MLEEGTWPTDEGGQIFNYLSKGQKVHIMILGTAFRTDNNLKIQIWTVSGERISREQKQRETQKV